MSSAIRPVKDDDAEVILAIYAPFVRESFVSFEMEVPSLSEIKTRIRSYSATHPWLVCELDGEVAGYAYANAHRSRTAYQWSTEVSVYVSDDHRRKGVGKALYTSLLATLKVMGFINAYAGISLPNEASVRLHESLGFEPVGIYKNVGFKQGQWRDVGWWGLLLNPLSSQPSAPAPLSQVFESEAFGNALTAGLGLLRT